MRRSIRESEGMRPLMWRDGRAALVLLASLWLAACGGDGGTTTPNSVTQTIGSAGGTVSLPDGSAITFAAGVFEASTSITLSSSSQAPEPLPDGVQSVSNTLAVGIPAGAFSQTLGEEQTITIQLPGAGTSAGSTKFSLIGPDQAFAEVSPTGFRAILMMLRELGGRKVITLRDSRTRLHRPDGQARTMSPHVS